MRTLLTLIVGTYLVSIGCSAFRSNSNCPDESDGIYPNCTCEHKNFDYSISLNECFRVCPEDSDGYWPECKCHFGGYFDKELFRCITCPADSTGQYPDCSCNDTDSRYNAIINHCEKCKSGSNGNFPNCTCPNGATYERYRGLCVHGCVWANNGNGSKETDYCMMCPGYPYGPFISTGNYPNCTCKKSFGFYAVTVYDASSNNCISCPTDSTGVYPNCTCEDAATYNKTRNTCIACNPFESDGVYPDCVCRDPGSVFMMHLNGCYTCPPGSTGDYPNCKCDSAYFSEKLNHCIKCPIEATGLYPACQCLDTNFTFSSFINHCYLPCPNNSSGIQPNCRCDREYFYNAIDKECKSKTGGMCPIGSIGIGPNCVCTDEYEIFDSFSWRCVGKFSVSSGFPTTTMYCPENNGKWPQCGTSIDFCVLKTCIG